MPSFECSDCDFIGKSSQGLGVHRSKKHNCKNSSFPNVKSVSVIREYPENRSFYCCLCNSIVLNYNHLSRHFKNLHPAINLSSSAKCSICGKLFSSGQGAGVHINKSQCSKTKITKISDEPIMTYAKYHDEDSIVSTPQPHTN